MPDMPPLETILIACVVFVVAGLVKGVIGLGLPTVSLALLTATIGLKPAMAVLVLPALLTNIVQAMTGGAFLDILRRTWVFILVAFVCTWLGTGILAGSSSPFLPALLGLVTATYAGLSLATPQFVMPKKWELAATSALGAVAGMVTGLTGTFVVPGVIYLQSLGFSKNTFIQSMGFLFTMASLSLGVGLSGHGLISEDLITLSVIALIPAFAGMFVGVKIRNRLDEVKFRKVFFVSLFILGLYIIFRSLIGAGLI
jgi:uncharacterized membrane protein YfcA